ncbi:hypothetical protein QE152_g25598 [Popillia japonica]|uniref:Uncharacterized protein n=1 Tax=Popillia japonica TaxID=7064 RepID=A0AAW1K0Q5_POPJA
MGSLITLNLSKDILRTACNVNAMFFNLGADSPEEVFRVLQLARTWQGVAFLSEFDGRDGEIRQDRKTRSIREYFIARVICRYHQLKFSTVEVHSPILKIEMEK